MTSEATAAAEPRRRVGIVATLLVIAAVVGVLASFAVWSARQLLETEQWTATSSELLEREEIRVAIADFMVDELFDNVDIEGELAGVLPPRLTPLAGPATGALRQLADRAAPQLLERPRVQALWEDINRAAHERFLAVVEGDAPAVTEDGGEVYLDMGILVRELGTNLGIGAASNVPEGVVRLDVMSADELGAAQDAVRLLKGAAYVLAIVALLLLALAVALASGWRRVALRWCGLIFVGIGVVVLAGRSIAGSAVVDALAATAGAQPAADAAWSVSTSLLGDLGVAMIGYGIAIVLGAWLAGPGKLAVAARRSITPFLRDRAVLYPILVAIVLLVFVWSPTEGTRRLLPSLLLVILLIGGAEALRRQARREFPDATLEALGERWMSRFTGLRTWGARRGGAGAPSGGVGDERIAQLERLATLRREGVLDDAELEAEKKLVRERIEA